MIRAAAAILALAAPASAQVAVNCVGESLTNLANIAEPLEETTRSYAQGAVRVLILAASEPACCGVTAAVLLPDPLDGTRICRVLMTEDGMGWGGLSFGPGAARYDPATGLAVPMTARVWDGADAFVDMPLTVTIDQSSGDVSWR